MNRLKSFFALASLFICFSFTTAYAEIVDRKHRFAFDSGYVEPLETNRAIAEFNLDFIEFYSFLSENLYNYEAFQNPDNRAARFLYFLGNFAVGSILAEGVTLAYHELGHGTRIKSMGFDPTYRVAGSSVSGNGYFPLFVNAIIDPFEGGSTGFNPGNRKFTPKESGDLFGTPVAGLQFLSPKANLIYAAGGLNNEMQMAHYLSEHIHENGGTLFMLPFYLTNKIGNLDYPLDYKSATNDMGAILNLYRLTGKNIHNSDLRIGNWFSLLASQTTWAFFLPFFKEGQDPALVTTYEFKNFRLPDFDFYINSRGISMKAFSSYKLDEISSIPFAVEYVYKGDKTIEATIGYEKKFIEYNNLKLRGDLLVGTRGIGVNLEADYPIAENMSIGGGYIYYDFHTLHGERNIPSLRNGSVDHELYARFSFYY